SILTYMYDTASASKFLILMSPFYLLLYIQSPLQATLQALDLAKPAMWNSFIGTLAKLIILILLTSNPTFGIMGTAIAMSFSVVLVTILHLASLKKMIQFMIPLKDIVKMIFLVGLTWQIGLTLKNIFMNTGDHLMMFL